MGNVVRHIGSSLALALDTGTLPSRIEVIATGELVMRDGRGHIGRISDPEAVIDLSMQMAHSGVIQIDFDHGMEAEGGDGRAAGWITNLSVEGDRIMGEVEWTPLGSEALQGKIYRFLSPTFYVSKTSKEVTFIERAALTNNPAFGELKQLASQQETPAMPKWLKDLAAQLGMPDEADEAKITAALSAAVDVSKQAAELVTAAGLEGALDETKVTAITAKMTASSETSPDPAKFVPIGQFEDLTKEVASLQKQVGTQTTDALVKAAMESGKVSPAMKDWATEYAAKDAAGFQKWAAAAPAIAPGGELITELVPPNDDGALTEDEKKVCAAMGVTEEAFLATKMGKAPAKKEA
ncbi:MAG: phage protease [Pseudomonadota bacterium]